MRYGDGVGDGTPCRRRARQVRLATAVRLAGVDGRHQVSHPVLPVDDAIRLLQFTHIANDLCQLFVRDLRLHGHVAE